MSNETQIEDANSQEGVVLANQNLPGLGFLVNYAIYDGAVTLGTLVEQVYAMAPIDEKGDEELYGENNERAAIFRSQYQSLIPSPRHGGSAFSLAVRALTTKAKRVVYDDPENPISNNKEKLRVQRNGEYGYTVQWEVTPLRRNKEYALTRVRRGYIDGQPRVQVVSDTLYRIRKAFPNSSFTREWMRDYENHVWGESSHPSIENLRKCVIIEPMKAESLPNDGRFMRQAQERLRDAFVSASMCIDDDKMRKSVRGTITRLGGILPHASSGGVYFVYDEHKTRLPVLNSLSTVIDAFAQTANTHDRDAMWVDRAIPWWTAADAQTLSEIPISAHYTSGMRSLTYGSSKKQIADIQKMYISTMQSAQAKYYQLVRQMLQDGEIDEELLNTKKAEVIKTLEKAEKDLGAETVDLATERYQEVVTGLTSRFQDIWTPDERASQEEKKRIDARIDSLLLMRLS